MKRALIFLVVSVFILPVCSGQEVQEKKNLFKTTCTNVEVGLGYLPWADYNALRLTGAINNLLWHRIGFYTTFDKGLDSDYFANIIGGSVSIIDMVSVYGGFDFFTSEHGMFHNGWDCRKEIGVGIYPYKGLAIRLGYSGNAGLHFGFGWRFPVQIGDAAPRCWNK